MGWTIIVSHKFIGNSVCTSSTFAIGPLIKITLAFNNAPFKPRNDHPSSVPLYPIGNLVGRSHFFLVSAVSSRVVFYIRVRRTCQENFFLQSRRVKLVGMKSYILLETFLGEYINNNWRVEGETTTA